MIENKKALGVIGGLGPMATAHFMKLIIDMTDVGSDQEHLPMLVYNMPIIPDRTGHILDNTKPSPQPMMLKFGQALTEQGADFIAVPCITAHYFLDGLMEILPTPFIHGVRETVRHLKENGVTKVGIMATDGTIQTGLLSRELQAQGLEPIIPDAENQAHVMHIIYKNAKAGLPVEMDRFHAAANHLRQKGAEATILGCTELSLVKRDNPIGAGFVDALEVLAQQCVVRCGMPLKKEYSCLITR